MQENKLKRKLTNRHIQFIALGASIGTGLFLGAGSAIFAAGPAVLLGYLIAGFLVFLMIRQLNEMNTEETAPGSYSYFAHKYWGKFPGFLAGWNHAILYILISIAELTAVAAYTQYWFPNIPSWETALFFFIIITGVNLATVKAYGEAEFTFSIVKITAICAMIIIGGYILFFDPSLVAGATIKNLWMPATTGPRAWDLSFSGFFPHGFIGLMAAFPTIIFAFDGLDTIGMSAAETADPKKNIPKATNQVVFRILIFYIGALIVLLSLYHWSNLSVSESPFVMIFDRIGFKYAAWTLNFIILTAALSVYNSCIYGNSRMLYGLALQKNAPKVFSKAIKKGVPVASVLFTSLLTFLVVPLNYFMPNWFEAFDVIMNFSVICIVTYWCIIAITHLKFKKQMKLKNRKTVFPSLFYPYSNYIVLVAVAFILSAMTIPQLGMAKQVVAIPLWLLIVFLGYKISKKKLHSTKQNYENY
ncbi:MAG: amino acid permease [Endomicrobium sp.]|jgi:L-asparagine transporter-like permease|nr:amino acid permease [Endomicrobium sp.]